jgi:tRNA pseudouridine55 synthase
VTAPAEHAPRTRSRAARRRIDGIVLLDKPRGLSSNHALQQVRRILSAAKAGHAGTLDPMATGMLPLCFGQATKTCGLILGASKAYRVCLRLGTATDTGDATGQAVSHAPVPALDPAAIARVLADLEGASEQVPPMYSALKHAGERMYELARRGESVARAARRIELRRLRLNRVSHDEIDFDVECSKGTYIRVLGEKIAARLGCVGHLSGLRRLWVAPFQSEPMVCLDEITSWPGTPAPGESGPPWLLPIDRALAGLPRLDLGPTDSAAIRHGRPVQLEMSLPEGSNVRAYDTTGLLLGLLRIGTDQRAHVVRLLANADQ